MSLDIHKPDLPLRLGFLVFRTILASPFGQIILSAGRRLLVSDGVNWFETTRLRLELPHLDPVFSGFRLVHISDFHIGTWVDKHRLSEVINQVNQYQPDMVAITGDFVTFTPEKFEADLVDCLSSIHSANGIVAVLGNHDHWADSRFVRKALKQANVIELHNSAITIRRGSACLHFAGVDDIMEGLDDLESVLDQIPSGDAAVLLAHEPDFADISARAGRFDLQLSGHTHGGQVCLPRLGPIVLPRHGRKYPSGHYRINGMQLYTNRGIGTAELQYRYRCPAEITLFELYPTKVDSF